MFRLVVCASILIAGCTEDGSQLLPGGPDGSEPTDGPSDGGQLTDLGPRPQIKLRGRVFRADGQPANHALIYSLDGVVGTFEALTDVDGHYRLETAATRLLARHRFDEVEIVTVPEPGFGLDIQLVPTEQRPETLTLGNVGMEMRFSEDTLGVYDYRIFGGFLHLLRALEGRLVWTKENLVTREVRTLWEMASMPASGERFLDVGPDALILPIGDGDQIQFVLYGRVIDEVAVSPAQFGLSRFLGYDQDGDELSLFFRGIKDASEPDEFYVIRNDFHLQRGFVARAEIREPAAASHCRSQLTGNVIYFDMRNPDGFYEFNLADSTFRMRQHTSHADHGCLQWVDASGPHGIILQESSFTVVHELENRLQTIPRQTGAVRGPRDVGLQKIGSDVLVTSNFFQPGPFFEFNPVTETVIELRDQLQPLLQNSLRSPAAKNNDGDTFILAQTPSGPERIFWDRAGDIRREPIIGNFDHPACTPIDLGFRDPSDKVDVVLCSGGGINGNAAFETTGTRRSFFDVRAARLGPIQRQRQGDWVARYVTEGIVRHVHVFDLKAPR